MTPTASVVLPCWYMQSASMLEAPRRCTPVAGKPDFSAMATVVRMISSALAVALLSALSSSLIMRPARLRALMRVSGCSGPRTLRFVSSTSSAIWTESRSEPVERAM